VKFFSNGIFSEKSADLPIPDSIFSEKSADLPIPDSIFSEKSADLPIPDSILSIMCLIFIVKQHYTTVSFYFFFLDINILSRFTQRHASKDICTVSRMAFRSQLKHLCLR
jgi:hypothetical protein